MNAIAPASHYQGGILLNVRTRVRADLRAVRNRINTRNGWAQVVTTKRGRLQHSCECEAPCGYRAFPGCDRPRDVQWSDCYSLLRRVGYSHARIDAFGDYVRRTRHENERWRRAGFLRKMDLMYLGRVPGPLVRGLCHDFPEEFSTRAGGTVDVQHRWLEKVLTDLFVNRVYRPRGVVR